MIKDRLTAYCGQLKTIAKVPAAELTETDEAFNLKLKVPGMEAKDLDIQVTANRGFFICKELAIEFLKIF